MKRLMLLCCLLLLAPVSAAASVSLAGLPFQQSAGAFAQCGKAASGPSGPFFLARLRAGQFHCLQTTFTIVRQPQRAQRLVISALASSELYLDGVRVGMNGVPASTGAAEIEGLVDYDAALMPEQLAAGPHQLVLKLSTWHGSDRIRNQFYALSIEDAVPNAAEMLLPLMLAGALALVALLFLGLLLFYQRKAQWTVFFLLCVSASLLLLAEAWRGLAGYPYGLHLERLLAVNLLTSVFALLLPAYFLVAYDVARKKATLLVLTLAIIIAASAQPHFDAKAALMFIVALVASAAINLLAYRRGAAGSRAGLAVALLSLGVMLVPGLGFFAAAGFALVVFLLLFAILAQLLRQFIGDRQKAALASRLENQLLRKSLQPHFLMNSLSLIGELVHQSPVQAEQFIEALGREFRMLGEYASQVTIPLSRELELCHNYLSIMSVRLQQRCTLQVRGDAGTLAVPPAVLLTCLENAFSHNKYREDLVFDLQIGRNGAKATLTLAMPLASPRPHDGGGTGSSYISNSLREAFSGAASYQGAARDSAWLVTIGLPA